MGRLRQIFSSIGVCDSDEDLARKPALIDRIVKYSMERTSSQGADESYGQRLRLVLDTARRFQLESLIENDVTVSLDRRLSNLNGGFWAEPIYSVFYGRTKTLSLYDNGKTPSETGLFRTQITAHSGNAIGDLVRIYLQHDDVPPLLLGKKFTTTYSSFFAWGDAWEFVDQIKQNPGLLVPPLKDAPRPGAAGLHI